MNFRDYIISEVRLHVLSKPKGSDSYYVIAFRGDVWIFDSEDLHTLRINLMDVMKKITSQHPHKFDTHWFDSERRQNHAIWTWVSQNIMDGFIGTYNPKEKYLAVWSERTTIGPNAPIIKKVCRALGVSRFYFNKQEYNVDDKKEEVFYHGTAEKFLASILRYGLDPKRKDSFWNIKEIKGYVYLSDNYAGARAHAEATAHRFSSSPVVLKVDLPDPSLLVPDYDMDRRSSGKHFYYHKNAAYYEPMSSVDSFKTSKMAGLFGYKGRIPPSHIQVLTL